MTDFSVPQRMSFAAFFIYFLKELWHLLSVILILAGYRIANSDAGFAEGLRIAVMWFCCAVALALILAAASYFQVKFHIDGGNLIYRQSLINRATTTIPLNRIHTLRTRRGLLYRLLGLRGIVFDTLAAKGSEIELILSESDWQSLLARVRQQERPQPASPDLPPAYNPSALKEFANKTLLLDALCQNHLKGMVILAGLAVALLNSLTELPWYSIDEVYGYLESESETFAVSLAGIAIVLACTYVVSLALWLGKVVVRYYDLTLTYDSKTLTFSYGLMSRLSSRFTRDKVCTLWVKRNYFEKRFGLCTLALKQALNSTAQKEDENLRIYGRDASRFFLGWWLGRDYASEAEIITAKSGKGVFTRSLLIDLLITGVAAGLLWHVELYAWITVPAIYLPVGLQKGILTMRHSNISLRESYLIIGQGRFAEIKNYVKYDNVEVVRLTRTPLTCLTGRVSLSLSTSGSTFTVRSLPISQAIRLRELLLT